MVPLSSGYRNGNMSPMPLLLVETRPLTVLGLFNRNTDYYRTALRVGGRSHFMSGG
ncbi:hypothetical protein AB0758_47985 [Tolypothrix bouteillei VB521301_2]|uniref:hypothetical protein n=1 Tax=Tolypothrix bouteillei TaxID=1246981 RepID=UPI0038B51AB0